MSLSPIQTFGPMFILEGMGGKSEFQDKYGIDPAGLIGWYTMGPERGDVSVWKDKSGRGHDFEQLTAAKQPTEHFSADRLGSDVGANGSFTVNTAGWTVSASATITRITTDYQDDTASARVAVAVAGHWTSYTATVVDGSIYEVSFWAKGETVSAIVATVRTAAGAGGNALLTLTSSTDISSGWTRIWGFVVANGTTMGITVNPAGAATGDFLIDNATFKLVDETSLRQGADLVSGWDFTSGWTTTANGTITDADTFGTGAGGAGGIYKVLTTAGSIYRVILEGSVVAGGGTLAIRDSSSALVYALTAGAGFAVDEYFNAVGTSLYLYNSVANATVDITKFELIPVTVSGIAPCRSFDGSNDLMEEKSYADETSGDVKLLSDAVDYHRLSFAEDQGMLQLIGFTSEDEKLEVLGTDLTLNGTFDSDVASWSATNGTATWNAGGQSGGCLLLTETGGGSARITQDISTGVSELTLWKYTVWVKQGTETTMRISLYDATNSAYMNQADITATATWTKHILYGYAPADCATIRQYVWNLAAPGAGTTVLIDSISLEQVTNPGLTQFQGTAREVRYNSFPNSRFQTDGATVGGADDFKNISETVGNGDVQQETTIVHSGTQACRLVAGAPSLPYIYNAVSYQHCIAGQKLRLSFWYYCVGADLPSYRIYDQDTNLIVDLTSVGGSASASWQQFNYDLTVATGDTSIQLRIYGNTATDIIIDDVRIDNMTAGYVYNGNFEIDGAGGADLFEGWDENTAAGGTLAVDATTYYTGTRSVKATCGAGAGNTSLVNKSFWTTPGTMYRWKFWTKGDGTTSSHSGRFYIYNNDVASGLTPSYLTTGIYGSTWTQVVIDFVAESTLTTLYFASPASALRSAWYDGMELFELEVDCTHSITLTDNAGESLKGYIGKTDFTAQSPFTGSNALKAELLTDGNMETDPVTNWPGTFATPSAEGVIFHGGVQSLQVDATGIAGACAQSVTMTAGAMYKLSGWIYADAPGDQGRITIYDNAVAGANIAVSPWVSAQAWTYQEVYCTAPANVSDMNILCQNDQNGDTCYYDDLSLKEVRHLGVEGIHIMEEKRSTHVGWGYKSATFERNDTTAYTFDIYKAIKHTGAFSYGVWIRTDTVNDNIAGEYDGSYRSWFLRINTDGTVRGYASPVIGGVGAADVSSTTAINDNNWHFICLVFDPGVGLHMYIDGVLEVTDSTSVPLTLAEVPVRFYFASYGVTPALFLKAEINSWFIFERALSVSEVLSIYETNKPVVS